MYRIWGNQAWWLASAYISNAFHICTTRLASKNLGINQVPELPIVLLIKFIYFLNIWQIRSIDNLSICEYFWCNLRNILDHLHIKSYCCWVRFAYTFATNRIFTNLLVSFCTFSVLWRALPTQVNYKLFIVFFIFMEDMLSFRPHFLNNKGWGRALFFSIFFFFIFSTFFSPTKSI